MFLFVILLAIVQGLTEFLPVSSSGHLALFEHLPWVSVQSAELQKSVPLLAFNVILHLGTLLSVIYFFRKDLKILFSDFFSDLSARKFRGNGVLQALLIVLATIPAVTVPLYKDLVEQSVQSLRALAFFFAINAVILFAADIYKKAYRGREEEQVTPLRALFIGVMQCVAVFPGISRSGATISAALLTGVSSYRAVRFSFLI